MRLTSTRALVTHVFDGAIQQVCRILKQFHAGRCAAMTNVNFQEEVSAPIALWSESQLRYSSGEVYLRGLPLPENWGNDRYR